MTKMLPACLLLSTDDSSHSGIFPYSKFFIKVHKVSSVSSLTRKFPFGLVSIKLQSLSLVSPSSCDKYHLIFFQNLGQGLYSQISRQTEEFLKFSSNFCSLFSFFSQLPALDTSSPFPHLSSPSFNKIIVKYPCCICIQIQFFLPFVLL